MEGRTYRHITPLQVPVLLLQRWRKLNRRGGWHLCHVPLLLTHLLLRHFIAQLLGRVPNDVKLAGAEVDFEARPAGGVQSIGLRQRQGPAWE